MKISPNTLSSPSTLLVLLVSAALVVSTTAAAAATEAVELDVNRSLQSQPYDYTSPNVRARAASISKDFESMNILLGLHNSEGREQAKQMYELGAYCQSFATLKLKAPLTTQVNEGVLVTGTSTKGTQINGLIHVDAFASATELKIQYLIPNDGIAKICSVAGNPLPQYDECFATDGTIKIGSTEYEYAGYDLNTDTANAVSLKGLSNTIAGGSTQGYPRIGTFAAYYGSNKYANAFIEAAFAKADTTLAKGNAEFSKFTQFGTNQFIQMATLTMNSWMHVIIKMMDAVQLCKVRKAGEAVTEVPIWDNAVATYRGLGGAAGGTMGQLYSLANNYCAKFGTCKSGPGNSEGMAGANEKAYTFFNSGKQDLIDGKCDSAEVAVEQAATAMTIPLIQGLLFHAYELDAYDETREVVQGESAAFLHALLPLVDKCNPGNAVMIYNEIKVGSGKTASFEVIKSSLESEYKCLGVTCADIGGILGTADKTVFQNNAAPCEDLNGDGIPDNVMPVPAVPQSPQPTPMIPPPVSATPRPTENLNPTSSPTNPPTGQDEVLPYTDGNDDGVTYALAVGLPVLSVIAIATVVIRSYLKKAPTGKEFDSAVGEGSSDMPEDEKVENLQAEIL